MKSVTVIKVNQLENSTNIFSDNLIKSWLKFAAVSEKSIATYTACLRQMNNYFRDNNIVNPIRADLENWRDMLIETEKAASTVALYLSSAKLFFRFLAQEGLYTNIADNLKNRVRVNHNHKKDALSEKQARQLLKAVTGKDVKALRDKAMIALMLTTGVRSIEVVRANIGDIRYIPGTAYLYVQGKGRSDKSECVMIAPSVMKLLQSYLKARGKCKSSSPLFVSTSRRNKDCRLDTQTIRKMVKSKMRKIGLDVPTLTCHSLRHTAATLMILNRQELSDVQMVLRHKSIATTMIYNNAVNRMKNHAELAVSKVLRI